MELTLWHGLQSLNCENEEEKILIKKCFELFERIEKEDNPVTKSVLRDIYKKRLLEYKEKYKKELVILSKDKINHDKNRNNRSYNRK